jgi:ATP-dependent DNA helicase RecG
MDRTFPCGGKNDCSSQSEGTMNLQTKTNEIPRIGPKYQERLKKLGIETVQDLIFHFPNRYEDYSKLATLSELTPNETACVKGKILEIKNIRTFKKRMVLTEAVVTDHIRTMKVLWFNQPYLTKALQKGDEVCLAGKLSFKGKEPYISNPSYEKISDNMTHTGRIVAIYPETEGVSSKWLRYMIKTCLNQVKYQVPEIFPKELMKENNLLRVSEAIQQIHFPETQEKAEKARERFSFEELFILSLFIVQERMKIAKENSIIIETDIDLMKKFTEELPFKLTDSQKKSAWQILKDLEKPHPMNRLLEGDVGSGKTIVAVMSALNTIKKGYQVAFMAPTEILAKQHFYTVSSLLRKHNLRIGLLTNSESKIIHKKHEEKITNKAILKQIEDKEIDIVIGTHSLIQDKIKFSNSNLGLVILDEQHRFGTEQRAKLCKQKDYIPHLLSMTATPIPRTLALTLYGDLDLSIIDELPKGRKEIKTSIVKTKERQKTYNFIEKEIKKGRQAFVICPRIEKGGVERDFLGWNEVKSVIEEHEKLSKEVFPNLKVGLLHGKMKGDEKEKIMNHFANKEIDILVSTSVVEVGVDIPNATVMMIEGSERFGLAQLHQFRGRVGRSDHQSYCFLFTDLPNTTTMQRLRALVKSNNGFELAEKDLKLRGPGSIVGDRQWGIPDLAMSALANIKLVEKTRTAATKLLEQDSQLKNYPELKQRIKRYTERIHLE